jgi:hypothetical protein
MTEYTKEQLEWVIFTQSMDQTTRRIHNKVRLSDETWKLIDEIERDLNWKYGYESDAEELKKKVFP